MLSDSTAVSSARAICEVEPNDCDQTVTLAHLDCYHLSCIEDLSVEDLNS